MLYAKGKTAATPGARGECPGCDGELIAKCGSIVQWHWAHTIADCDPWSEPETEWHVKWKDCFPKEFQEVVVDNHRADVLVASHAIEFQHSPISYDDIREREMHYDRLTWVLDGSCFRDRFLVKRPELRDVVGNPVKWRDHSHGWWWFTWSHAKKSFFYGVEKSSLVVDLGHLDYWDNNATYPCLFVIGEWGNRYGKGRFICRDTFVNSCLNGTWIDVPFQRGLSPFLAKPSWLPG
jgi:hypothetical protein